MLGPRGASVTPPQGPGSPFQLLFSDAPEGGSPLPEAFRRIYPGDWRIPDRTEQPYIYSNFATSRDGRITYQIPGLEGGADVTGYDAHDALLHAHFGVAGRPVDPFGVTHCRGERVR